MRTLSEFEFKAVKRLIAQKDTALKKVSKIEGELSLYQDRCNHPQIQTCQHQDFIMKFKGCCPDCGKVILSPYIINLLRGQYSKKE